MADFNTIQDGHDDTYIFGIALKTCSWLDNSPSCV